MFVVKVQHISGNQISLGRRLESRSTCSCDKLGGYCVIFVTVI